MSLDAKTSGIDPVISAKAAIVPELNPKVLIVTPWHKQVSPITSFCVGQLSDRRKVASMLGFGDAFVTHTRNTCADVFLSSPCEWMLTIDDDMVVPFGDAKWFKSYTRWDNYPEPFASLNALDRLLSHRKTLVGALYFGRHPGGPPVYAEGNANPQETKYARGGPHNEVKPTQWVGTGCMLVHRSVYEAIEKKFPRLARGPDGKGGNWFTSTEAMLMEQLQMLHTKLQAGPIVAEKGYTALCDVNTMIARAQHDNRLGSGEDVSFCLRASAAGHQPHVDMGLICGHIGHHVFGPRDA